ncbi:MAG: helix-turn-helix transcriptional regulator [Ruminococcus sp.]|nr:helix-turn-helix transcriptional regulator [Ruminococcus sp.]
MTLGEKIKEARKAAGLTQEQLAQKLIISRQAITKWEADKGIPDTQNLKALSKLLDVSVDYLLDDGQDFTSNVIKEPIDLEKYGKKRFNDKRKDMVVRERFPDAEIFELMANRSNKRKSLIDNAIGLLTDAPFGIPTLIDQINDMNNAYYLANTKDRQFFIIVSDEFIESRSFNEPVTEKKLIVGDVTFKRFRKI